ncbi:MAG: hypothetical protein A2171_00530 [Candidatus Levybacteria bacterium RBG_13_35_9]|nr:MAG: hypothetical protein A2171_00530 [Candidatus Levybacteria bacterium RBG_13_35_9]
MKFISVVIAAYNEEKNLPKCLDVIKDQNYPKEKYEIIVVDNNSVDKTAEIARSYDAKVVKEEKQGNTFAVKKGMDAAGGEIIAMVDADTIVEKNWLVDISKAFENENVVGVTGMGIIKSGNKLLDKFEQKFYEYFLKAHFLIGKPHITGFNLAVRKTAYDKIGGLDARFTMSPDVDLGLRLEKVGKVVFDKNIKAVTSFRRWQNHPIDAFITYFKGYLWTVWFRKPPPVKQKVIR